MERPWVEAHAWVDGEWVVIIQVAGEWAINAWVGPWVNAWSTDA